jgi:tRNA G10  N-methylase Trm11
MLFTPQSVAILGRQPALGIAELERLYGASALQPFGQSTCLMNIDAATIDFKKIGGSIRVAKILSEVPNDWHEIHDYLIEKTPQHAQAANGKLSFGISVFGIKIHKNKLAQTALAVKKAIKSSGQSVRMVPHTSLELNSATVLYNKLTSSGNWELLVISDGEKTYLAQTVAVQDIDAYAARDRERPMRDAKVGMLPPKLAQIIINLAVGTPEERPLILDAFCGTGVVLQEATLMDYDVYGSDLEPRMIEYSIANLNWLDEKYPDDGDYRRIEVGDAATFTWHNSNKITAVVGETYLGQALSSLPNSEHLSKIMYDVNLLHHKFLENIAPQIKSGTRLCLAIPTWRGKREFLHLPVLDHLTEIGYTRVKFKHVSNEDLIYHREGQVVGRELLVIIKN